MQCAYYSSVIFQNHVMMKTGDYMFDFKQELALCMVDCKGKRDEIDRLFADAYESSITKLGRVDEQTILIRNNFVEYLDYCGRYSEALTILSGIVTDVEGEATQLAARWVVHFKNKEKQVRAKRVERKRIHRDVVKEHISTGEAVKDNIQNEAGSSSKRQKLVHEASQDKGEEET